jgi:hypothetical protein
MEDIVRELIRDSIKHHDCLEDLLWEFTEKIDADSICDLLQIVTVEEIYNYLERRNEHYQGHKIINVVNLYVLVMAKEILEKDFPKLYSEVKA